ncbi:MAG: hypothetical protein K6T59_07740 [Bryobacteraceae bacterium]|nr:hypothetical protein [Bryobacteraceae bacterium]
MLRPQAILAGVLGAGLLTGVGMAQPFTALHPAEHTTLIGGEKLVLLSHSPRELLLGRWAGDALVTLDDSSVSVPVINVYDREGRIRRRVPITIQGAATVKVYTVSHGAGGWLAASGSAYTAEPRGGTWLALISPDGRSQRVVRTNPFIPAQVVVAPDGAIWALGYEKAGDLITREHRMLRRFNSLGTQTGAYLPRSLFPGPRIPHPADRSFLAAGSDRIGWYSHITGEYVEWSLSGEVLTRLPGPRLQNNDEVHGLALCPDNQVYVNVSRIVKRPVASEILRLDRAQGVWSPVTHSGERFLFLYGCGSDGLLTETVRSEQALQWFLPSLAGR